MSTYPIFHATISAKELRPNMPAVPFLLSAASFLRQNSKGQCSLRTPRYLPASLVRGADCGGFTATMRWGGHYRFTPVQYVRWLYGWRPQWAATFDLLCLSPTGGDPGTDEVKARQRWTTKMAWHFWLYVRDSSWSWTPTIQGYHPEDFERHARSLLRLIREMQAYYFDPGWGEDEDEGPSQSAFRVGIGSLCRRSPAFIQDVVARVRAIIGKDIALHLWGVKLRVLQAGLDLPGVISCDSGAWNGLYGKQHEQRRASGLSVVEYSWRKQYPDYARKLALAQQQPHQAALDWYTPQRRTKPFPDHIQLMKQITQFY